MGKKMRLRTIGICLTTITVCTVGSAAYAAIPHLNEDSNSCMFPGNSGAYLLGIFFGWVGFLVSLVLSPVIVVSDQALRDHRKKMKVQHVQAGNNALSLLRAAACPPTQARAELLRPAQSGRMIAPEHLLRAVQTSEPNA